MKVFISYSKEDSEEAKRIYNDLHREGITAWIDSEYLLPGQNWKKIIRQEIETSTHFLVLLSANSVSQRGYLQKELRIALDIYDEIPDSQIFIIPVRIEDVKSLPMDLKDIHYVDLFPDYKAGFTKILKVLKPERKRRRSDTSSNESENEYLHSLAKLPFIGREDELQKMSQFLQQASCGKPEFILIQGDFGVGKTLLIEHFLAEAEVMIPSILIGRGKCVIETGFSGLTPFSHFLNNISGHRKFRKDRLLNILTEVAPAWKNFITGGFSDLRENRTFKSSHFTQENIFVQFTNALARIAEKHPIIVFIDDLHWADGSSLGLLFHLSRYLKNCPILFVCTYRPVEAMEIGPNAPLFREIRANLIRHGAKELELRIGIDVAEYANKRYPRNAFTVELTEHAQKFTEGHALFVNQMFSLWEDTGVIVPEKNSEGQTVWKVTKNIVGYPVIPKTLSEVLEERIRLMEENLRDILTCASIEGEDFTAQVIARLKKIEEYEAYESLETLERRYRLIREQGTKLVGKKVMDFYRFIHRFFREHIYQQLSLGKRRILHKQMGECLELLYDDRFHIAGQLALHFKEAYEIFKSIQYALLSAQFEMSRYAYKEVLSWCEFGLSLIERLPLNEETNYLKLHLLIHSGYGNYYSGVLSDAHMFFDLALRLAQEIKVAEDQIIEICTKFADICDNEGQIDKMVELVETARKSHNNKVKNKPIDELYIEIEERYARSQIRLGNQNYAIEILNNLIIESEKLTQTESMESALSDIYNDLAMAFEGLCLYDHALTNNKKAIDISEKIGNNRDLSIYMTNRAYNYNVVGKYEAAMAWVEKSYKTASQLGDIDNMNFAMIVKGSILLRMGKPHDAIECLQNSRTILKQIGESILSPFLYAELALAYLSIEENDIAFDYSSMSLSEAEKRKIPEDIAYAQLVFGQIETSFHHWDSASSHFIKAISLSKQIGDTHRTAQIKRHFAEMLNQKNEKPKALEMLHQAMEAFKELNLKHDMEITRIILDNIRDPDLGEKE